LTLFPPRFIFVLLSCRPGGDPGIGSTFDKETLKCPAEENVNYAKLRPISARKNFGRIDIRRNNAPGGVFGAGFGGRRKPFLKIGL
jgi:hypothetical protein